MFNKIKKFAKKHDVVIPVLCFAIAVLGFIAGRL